MAETVVEVKFHMEGLTHGIAETKVDEFPIILQQHTIDMLAISTNFYARRLVHWLATMSTMVCLLGGL